MATNLENENRQLLARAHKAEEQRDAALAEAAAHKAEVERLKTTVHAAHAVYETWWAGEENTGRAFNADMHRLKSAIDSLTLADLRPTAALDGQPTEPELVRKMVRIFYFADDYGQFIAFHRDEIDALHSDGVGMGSNPGPIESALIPAPRRKGTK